MTGVKQIIIDNLCYTMLVYGRINKKLSTDFSNAGIESLIHKVLKDTNEKYYTKAGKNYYITNSQNNIRITINSNTFRVITVDKLRDE